MKKYLLYIFAVIALASCIKQPSFDTKVIAEQCMREWQGWLIKQMLFQFHAQK